MLNHKQVLVNLRVLNHINHFFYHNDMQLKINYKKTEKFTNTRRLSNTVLSTQGVKGETKREFKNYLEKNKNVNTTYQTYEM